MKYKINKYGLVLSMVLYLIYPFIYFEEIFMDFFNQYKYIDVLVTVIATMVCVGMAYVFFNKIKMDVIGWKDLIVSIFVGYAAAILLIYLISEVLYGKGNIYPITGTILPYNIFKIANVKYLIFVWIYVTDCAQAAIYIKNRKDNIVHEYSATDKKKTILMGMLTSAILYFAYPYIKFHNFLDIYSNNYYEAVSWSVVIICAVAVYALNYCLTRKVEIYNIKGWKYIIIGTAIGTILIFGLLLLLSVNVKFGTYIYIDMEIPFNLFDICNLKYYLYVIMYAIFFKEMTGLR